MYKLIFFLLLIISCQNNDSKLTSIPASHIGEWETDCYSNGNSTYGVINLVINSESLELTTEVFSDSNCNSLIGEYNLYSNSYERSLNTYTVTVDTFNFTPKDPTYAGILNSNFYCGTSPTSPNWVDEVPQSLFGRTCSGNEPEELINSGHEFEIEAVRSGDTLDTNYSTEIFYKI
jgi:hypothetical protein